ncbi:glycogen debranching protein [Anaeromyxobacter oryzae]|uniref:Glycogen debranching enzyme n=1 Tax=Anaeromyxobacter oryzae TaxID=2918170 RepID=A0ABN6MPK7_9BACT|nr:isoamylase [Anaeromyxobacter oryzae]BDG02936.1 glycogen debranching enzyme [Anaeromyxobacter oryzae]
MNAWDGVQGNPIPCGVSRLPGQRAYNFAVYSRHASAVSLLLYGDDPATPVLRVDLQPLSNKTGRVWHCRVPEEQVRLARCYAYAMDGPNDGSPGHSFDRDKVLFDPYAPALHFPAGFDRAAACGPGSNAGRAPLGVLPAPDAPFDWTGDRHPVHGADTIVYELHVRNFTMTDPSVPLPRRGTFAGIVDKIPYLRDLGVTVVELMPVFQCDPQEGSTWGYMPLHFFSPHDAYSSAPDPGGRMDELRALVKALHQADIEVVLDVVFNHTTEGGAGGPTYSYRGIDNSTYYLLADDMTSYRNDAGTGNVLRTAHSVTRKLVLDCLRFWVREAHVDGFRFDLATILTRNEDGTVDVDDPAIIDDIASDPQLSGIRLIAEAWDPGTYQLGRLFPGRTWFQWNGRFRDDVRDFVKGTPAAVGRLMTRLYGSDDLFPDGPVDVYRPFQSVNFVTCHDGFCLYDLVAYDRKHNEQNGHGNTDGSDDNRSWNCGFEGDPAPPDVMALRKRQARNFAALLFLSNGIPMLSAGDEFLRTQRGNNNPYNQDGELTWVDWSRLDEHRDVHRFFQGLIALRKAHRLLGHGRFWRERVSWYGMGATKDLSTDSHALAFCLHGDVRSGDPSLTAPEPDLYVMINAWWQDLTFQIQEPGTAWRRVVDTARVSPDDYVPPERREAVDGRDQVVKARSIVVLEAAAPSVGR